MDAATEVAVDLKLVQRAQMRATGADVHRIRCLLHGYQISGDAMTSGLIEWRAMFQRYERVLRIYVATGRIEEVHEEQQ